MEAIRTRAVALVCAIALAAPSVAWAEASKEDIATAKGFVKEGRDLRDKGDHKGALEKFKAAYALVPTPITGLDYGKELVANGLLVDAREVLVEVVKMPAAANEKKEYGEARAAADSIAEELKGRIPSLVIKVEGGGAYRVTLDDREVPAAALGLPRKVNPGTHVVAISAGGGPAEKKSITVEEGKTAEVSLAVPAAGAAPGDDATKAPAAPEVGSSSLRWVGLATAGVGVVAMGVSGVLALGAKSRWDESAPFCREDKCTQEGLDIRDDGRSRGNVATVVFGIGAVAAVSGVVLFLTAPKASPAGAAQLKLNVGLSDLVLSGAF